MLLGAVTVKVDGVFLIPTALPRGYLWQSYDILEFVEVLVEGVYFL